MRRGGRILVMLGIVLGLVTALGTFVVLSSSQQPGPAVATRSVVVAQQNIGDLAEIPVTALGKADWPEAALPQGGVFEKIEDVAGKVALQPIYPGQIILPQMIISKDQAKETKTYASLIVPDGKVAAAFLISPLTGVASAIQPGDSVDMLLTLSPTAPPTGTVSTKATTFTGLEGLPVTQIFLQDVLVAQVGTWTAGVAADKNAPVQTNILTFILDRQDALALKAASEQGQVELVLRHAGDHKIVQTEPVNLQYLNKRFNFNLVPLPR